MSSSTRRSTGIGVVIAITIAWSSVAAGSESIPQEPPTRDGEWVAATPVTEAEKLTDHMAVHIGELREVYGLDGSLEFVHRLYSAPAEMRAMRSQRGLVGAALFTRSELTTVERHAELEWAGYQIDLWLSSRSSEYFGTAMKPSAVEVTCVKCSTIEWHSEIIQEFDLETDEIIVRSVDRTLRALTDEAQRLGDTLTASGMDWNGSISSERNIALIHVPDVEAATQVVEPNEFVDFDSEYVAASLDVNKDVALGYNLVEGGQHITSETASGGFGSNATSGFAVQSSFGPFIMTMASRLVV